MATAAQRVFATPELLEAILLELPLTKKDAIHPALRVLHTKAAIAGQRTVIASQRVSRAFRQTIRGSSKLQQAAGFKRDHLKTSSYQQVICLFQPWPICKAPYVDEIGPVEVGWQWEEAPRSLISPNSFVRSPILRCTLRIDATFPNFQSGSWKQLLVAPPYTSIERIWLSWKEKNECFVFSIGATETTHLINPTLGDLVEFAEALVQGKKCRNLEMKLGDGGKNLDHGFNRLSLDEPV